MLDSQDVLAGLLKQRNLEELRVKKKKKILFFYNNIYKGRWPVKSVKVVLGLLDNLSANATVKIFFSFLL